MATVTLARPHAARRRAAPTAAALRPAHYLVLVATVAVLNVIGVVMVLSASSVLSITTYGSAWYFFERQLIWTVLGALAFGVTMRIDYRRWREWTQPLLFVAAGMLVLVLDDRHLVAVCARVGDDGNAGAPQAHDEDAHQPSTPGMLMKSA